MSRKKYSKSFEIALSAVSCAVAVTFLSLGILSGYLLAFGYLVGILALMVPLSKRFYVGGFLAYASTCILTLVLGAAGRGWDLVPFIMFFGLHPLANSLQLRYKINRWLALAVKAVWFDCTLVAGYFLVFGGVMGISFLPAEWVAAINQYMYLFIFTLGTAAFVFYDFLVLRCQRMINTLIYRIKR